ncbi:TPA: chromosomal replication initiator protein DnaA [Candidatus Gracilibacteria bacterium]|nr:chromosomal replication initiator protein DnaA [Candidatus Peregrinibacteria bacterium]HIQ56434.1 chromosomal replication initiator protein DnaA [Candidatus Gracilibacteria bacterium]HIQ57609.1 chromosomal replication initiator protein DnaA [Candidatus Gracilibacteria bacterium]
MPDLLPLWEEILLDLSKKISKGKVMTWFLYSTLKSVENNTATIGTSREFYKDFITNNGDKILEILRKKDPLMAKVEVVVDGSLENENSADAIDMKKLFLHAPKTSTNNQSRDHTVRKLPKQSSVQIKKGSVKFVSKMLDTNFTLRNFVVGEETQLAHAASQAVANKPGGAYNPLFLYGTVGLGKTHLLQATANEILRKFPNKLVVYLTTENFIAEVVEAIQKRRMEQVRKKYRLVDVFILDDIQFLAGKDRTQEIFFHLFNDLYNGKKQMIFSSDRPPAELELTEDRLKSRFSMGMIADLQFPDFETRLAIAKVKCAENGILIPDDILNFIAYNVQSSIRELQGIILQVKAMIELTGKNPTIESVSKMLQKLNNNIDLKNNIIGGMIHSPIAQRQKLSTMEDLVKAVCEYYHTEYDEVIGTKRSRVFMRPRQVSMFLIKKHMHVSLQSIGDFFSGRDHTSVLHSTRKVEKEMKEKPEFWKEIKNFEDGCDFV